MQLVLDNLESIAPVILRGLRMSDDEFLDFCQEHEDLRVESNANGEIELMAGTGPKTGRRNAILTIQLGVWALTDARGSTFDSSTLFVLPSGARRSPDASWISAARIAAVPAGQEDRLWHICPEFVIELRSHSDRGANLDEKMREWIANGVELGWLIDPENRSVAIYRPGHETEIVARPASIAAGPPVAGFVLDLSKVF